MPQRRSSRKDSDAVAGTESASSRKDSDGVQGFRWSIISLYLYIYIRQAAEARRPFEGRRLNLQPVKRRVCVCVCVRACVRACAPRMRRTRRPSPLRSCKSRCVCARARACVHAPLTAEVLLAQLQRADHPRLVPVHLHVPALSPRAGLGLRPEAARRARRLPAVCGPNEADAGLEETGAQGETEQTRGSRRHGGEQQGAKVAYKPAATCAQGIRARPVCRMSAGMCACVLSACMCACVPALKTRGLRWPRRWSCSTGRASLTRHY
jgi:hypothetical protein